MTLMDNRFERVRRTLLVARTGYASFSPYFFVAFSEYIRGIMSLAAGSVKR